MSKDEQSSQIYLAEKRLRLAYDGLVETGSHVISIKGITLTMPPETRFTSVKAIQDYIKQVCSLDALAHYPRSKVKVNVGYHDDDTMACYWPQDRLICVPRKPSTWALRELIILHELTHHFTIGEGHGQYYAGSYLDVLGRVMGPEVELAMRLVYDHYQVTYQSKFEAAS